MSAPRVWVDEYRPGALSELSFNAAVKEQLEHIAATGDIPHITFYGPNGAGKATCARLLLAACFGSASLRREIVQVNKTTEFAIYGSNHHSEILAADLGVKDRLCIQAVIKTFAGAQTGALGAGNRQCCRVFVIHEAHCLSHSAQAALRRTMERYAGTCRIFLLTERLSSLLTPLRSRCICIRVNAPTTQQMTTALNEVAAKEPKFPAALIPQIVERSDRNMRRALVLSELIALRKLKSVPLLSWEKNVQHIVQAVTGPKPSVNALLSCRAELQQAYLHNVDSQLILGAVVAGVLATGKLSFEAAAKVAAAAAHFSSSMAQGSRDTFHLEGFVAHCLTVAAAG